MPQSKGCPPGNFQYQVSYVLVNRGQCEDKLDASPLETHTIQLYNDLIDLEPYSTYAIQVRAQGNDAGYGRVVHKQGRTNKAGKVDFMQELYVLLSVFAILFSLTDKTLMHNL